MPHDAQVGKLLKKLDDLGIANNTIVLYSTDNGPHYNTWPDAGTTPFRSEKNSNWEGAYRLPAFVRLPGHFPAGTTLNGIVAHEDWLPTFAAIGGDMDVKERLLKGTTINGREYRTHLDGYNLLDYLSGRTNESPRKEFWYVNDDGQVVAARYDAWKVVFLENRGQGFGVWREPFTELRVPLLFNLRRDPFERAQHNANVYNDWFLERAFVVVPIRAMAAKFLLSMKDYPPSQSPGSFNLTKIEEQGTTEGGGGRTLTRQRHRENCGGTNADEMRGLYCITPAGASRPAVVSLVRKGWLRGVVMRCRAGMSLSERESGAVFAAEH